MRAKLSDLCEIVGGGTPSRSNRQYWDNGTIPWVKISDFDCKYLKDTTEYITEDGLKNSSTKIIKKGSIVYTIFATLGEVCILDIDATTNQAIAGITIKDNRVELEYLYYFLKSLKPYVNSIGRGVAQNNINISILRDFDIPLPSKERQIRISQILKKTYAIITNRQQQIEELELLIQSRFSEMFGDPDKNPLGWVECALSKKINVIGGYAFKSEKFDENSGIPVLRIGNINTGYFKPVNMVYWKKDENLERYAIYPGDLVISLTGTVGKDDYGNVCILGNNYEMYYLNQRNAKLEILEGLDKYYLSQLLKFEQIKKKLTGISRGVRQANISNKDILDLVIPVPPIEIQKQFAKFIQQVDKSKFVIQKSIDETQELFDSLMQEYFG